MEKIRYFLLFLVVCLCIKANCQTFKLLSLDSKDVNIVVSEDVIKNKLNIINGTDRITIDEFTDLDGTIEVLKRHFLKITYAVRGGSGIKERHTLLVCISNNKLVESFHFLSSYSETFDKTYDSETDKEGVFDEHYSYFCKLDISGSRLDNFTATVAINAERISKVSKYDNYKYSKVATLRFNRKTGAFYSDTKTLNDEFKVYEPQNKKERNLRVKGAYPSIELPEHKYVRIENIWYEMSDEKHLFALSYRNPTVK